MRTTILVCFCSIILLSVGTSFAGDWATSGGSCYGKGDKNISFGMSILYFGFYGAFDYGFHDCISGGIASGYNGYFYSRYWRYNHVPVAVRAAFHPFNLRVLADKIRVRNKLDVFVGISTGWRVGWATWREDGEKVKSPKVGGFFVREYLGIRFFPTENFYLSAEEGSGLALLNLGVGFRF